MKSLCTVILFFTLSSVNIFAQQSGDYYASGNKFFREGEYEKAVEQYTKAIQLDPRNGNYYASLGATYGKLSLYEKGIKELKKAVSVTPKLEEPYYLIESFYATLDRTDEAIGFFQERSKTTPNNAFIYVNLGYAFYRKGILDMASVEMKKAIEFDSLYSLAHCGLGVIYLSLNRDEEAEKEFEKALQINPDYPEAHLYMGIIYKRAKRDEESQRELEKAYALKPKLKDVNLDGTLPIRGRRSKIPLLSMLPDDFQRSVDLSYRHIKLNLGVGITNIEDENWYSLTTHPEMDFSYFGAKVDLEFLVNGDGQFRKTDLEYEKILNYVRLGNAGKPFYLMGGKIDNYTIGYGSIMQNYKNQSDESNRKIGAILALRSPFIDLDGMLNTLEKPDVFGGRVGLKISRNLEAGVSGAKDIDQDGDDETDDPVTIYGGDVTFLFSPSRTSQLGLLVDVAKIEEHGMGTMLGVLLLLQGRDVSSPKFSLFSAYINSGEGYEPGFFGAFYEKERIEYRIKNLTKLDSLNMRYPEPSKGLFSKASISLPPVLDIAGTYQTVFGVDSSGVVTLIGAFLPSTNLIARVAYNKVSISTLEEAFALDENTVTEGLLGYWINSFTAFMLNYQWTYVWDEEEESYKTQQRVSPILHISAQF